MSTNLEIEPFESWAPQKGKIFVVSGPCSAETEEQTLNTFRDIAALGKVDVLRAGIWKPRTRPGEFEGGGEKALKWVMEAHKSTGLPVTVEVANANHVEIALKAGVHILWIGARSTVNPFTIQEIADALQGVDIPVMVKNPISPDIALWCGAMERINKAGIKKMAAIHRGFTPLSKSILRNDPHWDLIIKLKIDCPELPIICDPSHICGNREMIPYICQKAIDLDMQGLMIESHIHPDSAWTDAKQQVTPNALSEILSFLELRTPDTENPEFKLTLEHIRAEIDKVDDAIFKNLSERMSLVEKIAEYKKQNQVTPLQKGRFENMLQKRKEIATILNLDQQFVEKLLTLVHEESINKQQEIMNQVTDSGKV